MRRLGTVLALGLALGCHGDPTDPETLVPERIGTVEMPPNPRDIVTLLSDETSGPGEFEYIARVIGGVDGTLGARPW